MTFRHNAFPTFSRSRQTVILNICFHTVCLQNGKARDAASDRPTRQHLTKMKADVLLLRLLAFLCCCCCSFAYVRKFVLSFPPFRLTHFAWWWRGVVVNMLVVINEVALLRTRLVLGCVTVYGLYSAVFSYLSYIQRYKYFRFRWTYPVVGYNWNCLRTLSGSVVFSTTHVRR